MGSARLAQASAAPSPRRVMAAPAMNVADGPMCSHPPLADTKVYRRPPLSKPSYQRDPPTVGKGVPPKV
jgi:hypothetical protein